MLLDTLLAVRRRSAALIAPLEPEDLMVQGMADASPPKWHLGQTNWFFDTFVLQPHVPRHQAAAGPAQLPAHLRRAGLASTGGCWVESAAAVSA